MPQGGHFCDRFRSILSQKRASSPSFFIANYEFLIISKNFWNFCILRRFHFFKKESFWSILSRRKCHRACTFAIDFGRKNAPPHHHFSLQIMNFCNFLHFAPISRKKWRKKKPSRSRRKKNPSRSRKSGGLHEPLAITLQNAPMPISARFLVPKKWILGATSRLQKSFFIRNCENAHFFNIFRRFSVAS